MQAATASQEQAHKEMMVMLQAERAANEARFAAEVAARTAGEAKQRAEEARKRTAAVQEQARKDAEAAHEQARKLQEAADEEKRKATAAQEAANASRRVAEEEVKTANAAQEEAEQEGIQPVVTPTPKEVSAVKRRVQYREDLFHFAVAEVAGGKSFLINAFRGLRNKDAGSAATGVTETTLAMARYPDPNPEYPYVWYDSAGTLRIPDWQYFSAQGLYVFDCIIILLDNRFTMTDLAILTDCRRFKILTDDDDDESEDQKKLYQDAGQQFIQQTRQSVKDNQENANMPDQRVYIVSNKSMLGVVKGKRPKKVIDEIEFLNDLIGEAQTRRARPQ
ncbi:hypothetical protein BDR07DRAFT_1381963 [Suillus spraguei]|nr:hypothetical protein BDR07DRAFT_1381963 [Suillus spraguei]